ncbi:CLUMA_CG017968, isoform A [Clunio marinus]|uniref:CLUMA_CG017968, isoform A n=1 Tax=Clunio marinus TaxID=568069 RepID=A0A1J1IZJ5_9DIPT|nr:CLUMA_CG017968, isoform A [Clunio marinus]
MNQNNDEFRKLQSILDEKERDLLLSASIGKELLEKNSKLEDKIIDLETELRGANENLEQISYQLTQKNDLINILTSDDECRSENEREDFNDLNSLATPTTSKSINLELMQRKITTLEEENKALRTEVQQIVQQTDEVEETEKKIIDDLSHQLNNRSMDLESLSSELERYKDENRLQYDEISTLTKRADEAEMRLHQLTSENEETSSLLCITKENQDLLAHELAEFKSRYYETLALLRETQEHLRTLMKKSQPCARSSFIPGIGSNNFYPIDSIHSEILDSLDSGIISDHTTATTKTYKNVCDTMKFVQNSAKDKQQSSVADEMSAIGSMAMSSMSKQPRMSSFTSSSSSKIISEPFCSTIYGSPWPRTETNANHEEIYPAKSQIGVPGCPGAKDLEEALKRLNSSEILSRRAMLSNAPDGTFSYDDQPTCRTPESIFSTLSAETGSGTSSTTAQWKLPKKLEIIKPLEGSQTLNHWSRLATPTMGRLLEDNERIKVRGEKRLEELGLQMYSLSDVEEDTDEYPGKQFESSTCVYTFTNSTVMHPDDGTSSISFSLPPSQISSRMQSTVTSRQPTAPPTPRNLSRRNSCSTFSVNMGLASVLNERGIKAVTPSALNTPSGPNFSPTVTPCNSPTEGNSPTRSLSPEPGTSACNSNKNKNAFIQLEKKALRSLMLLERVETLGLENIVAPSRRVSPLALYSSNIYSSRSSPMAQLTSLRKLTENRYSDENLKSHVSPSSNESQGGDLKKHSDRKSRVNRQKSRRQLINGHSGQRQDLGTVNTRPDLGKVENERNDEKSLVEGFVGSISSLLFGRKGGLL